MEIHTFEITSRIRVPSSSLIPLLEKMADSITMRIGRPNSRSYWDYYPYTARFVDCTRERVAV
jgi:hypothetical protein